MHLSVHCHASEFELVPSLCTRPVCGMRAVMTCSNACRTPEVLMQTVEAVLRAYEAQAGSRGLVKDAASLMNPEVIDTMRQLQKQIRKGFM